MVECYSLAILHPLQDENNLSLRTEVEDYYKILLVVVALLHNLKNKLTNQTTESNLRRLDLLIECN